MKQISEEETKKSVEEGQEEARKTIIDGGKIMDTIIYEKDKTTVIRKIEPVNSESTCSKTVTTKDEISINFL